MATEKDILFIEKYFDNELSESEKDIFEERLEGDTAFRELFEQEKALIASIRYRGLLQQLEGLKSVEKSLSQNNSLSASHDKKMWYYAAAASVTVILILSLWLFRSSQQSPEELFQTYYKPYPNVFEPTLRGNDMATKRSEAFQAYEQGNYEKAVVLFNELLEENQDSGILLLLSNSHLSLGQTAEAKENLLALLNEYDDKDIQAKWLLSLCYLKEDNKEEAQKMLKELSESESSYAERAKELLGKMD